MGRKITLKIKKQNPQVYGLKWLTQSQAKLMKILRARHVLATFLISNIEINSLQDPKELFKVTYKWVRIRVAWNCSPATLESSRQWMGIHRQLREKALVQESYSQNRYWSPMRVEERHLYLCWNSEFRVSAENDRSLLITVSEQRSWDKSRWQEGCWHWK